MLDLGFLWMGGCALDCCCGDWVWGVGAKICGFMVVVSDGFVLLMGLMVDFGSLIGGFWVCRWVS